MIPEEMEIWLAPISDEFPCGKDESKAVSLENQFRIRWDGIVRELRGFGTLLPLGGRVTATRETQASQQKAGRTSLPLSAGTQKEISELLQKIKDCFRGDCKSLFLGLQLPLVMMLHAESPAGFNDGLRLLLELLNRYPDEMPGRGLHRPSRAQVRSRMRKGYYSASGESNFLQLFNRLRFDGEPLFRLAQDGMAFRNSIRDTDPEKLKAFHNSLLETVSLIEQAEVAMGPGLLEVASGVSSDGESDGYEPALFDSAFVAGVQELEVGFFEAACEANDAFEHSYAPEPTRATRSDLTEPVRQTAPQAAADWSGPIKSKRQALAQLREVAAFFEQTEPHSPISYSIRQTIDWADLKLPQLWQTLFDGGSASLEDLSKRIGFKLPEKPS